MSRYLSALNSSEILSVKRRLDTGFIGAERQLESGFGTEAAG
jgi:hypothetical protein